MDKQLQFIILVQTMALATPNRSAGQKMQCVADAMNIPIEVVPFNFGSYSDSAADFVYWNLGMADNKTVPNWIQEISK